MTDILNDLLNWSKHSTSQKLLKERIHREKHYSNLNRRRYKNVSRDGCQKDCINQTSTNYSVHRTKRQVLFLKNKILSFIMISAFMESLKRISNSI